MNSDYVMHALTLPIEKSILTTEYDSRCRAHDAEERRVNRRFQIIGGATHLSGWVLIKKYK